MAFNIGVVDYQILMRLLVAAIAGGLIGLEREALHKPAGVRTHMLVSLGAALFVLATLSIIPGEVGRIMAGVATGIGFLGAGTIFRSKDHVKGLTSAASIWAVAAIGLTVGGGQYVLAIAATILVILVLQLKRIGL